MSTAVIIARFQTPYLHEGHKHLIDEIKKRHNKLIIVLGVSPVKGGRKNPFDYYTRERMIKSSYPDAIVLPTSDHPNDKVWSKNLDNLLNQSFPSEEFILYGSRDSFIPHYSGKYKTYELPEHGEYNATEIREMYADLVGDSQDFRAGILYALHNQYEKVYPTVDVVVFRNDKTEILLGKKAINNKWRFVGGFVDPTDDSNEAAAKRELSEEVGQIETTEMKYETSIRVEDWRYRNEVDKIFTTFFSCDYVFGSPKAQDDIADVAWFKISDIRSLIDKKETTPEHLPLFEFLLNKYLKTL